MDVNDEEQWCAEQRRNVVDYLAQENCPSTSIGEWPAWHVAPVISVWAVESVARPGSVGWWAVSGDFPTDYAPCGSDRHPRQGLRDIGLRWQEAAKHWASGNEVGEFRIGDGGSHEELASLLATRAATFLQIAGDDVNWPE